MWEGRLSQLPPLPPNSCRVTVCSSGRPTPLRKIRARAAYGALGGTVVHRPFSSASHSIGSWPSYWPVRCATTRIPSMPTRIVHFPPMTAA